jgi:hypothetical protein
MVCSTSHSLAFYRVDWDFPEKYEIKNAFPGNLYSN